MELHRRIISLALLAASLVAVCARAERPGIPPEQFSKLHKIICVQPGEQRFWEVPWKLTITEAREEATRLGKPILVWAGAGGAPIGVC
jgi:hypothetical protein